MDQNFHVGQRVKCEAHDGKHTGKVAALLGPDGLGIAWDGHIAFPQTEEEHAFMRDLVKSHDLMYVPSADVEVSDG